MQKNKLKDSLKKLKEIVEWFDNQEEADVEMGLLKVKEGAVLVKESKSELKKLENEFEKVKKDLEKKKKVEQMTVLGAGVFANAVFALLFYLLPLAILPQSVFLCLGNLLQDYILSAAY